MGSLNRVEAFILKRSKIWFYATGLILILLFIGYYTIFDENALILYMLSIAGSIVLVLILTVMVLYDFNIWNNEKFKSRWSKAGYMFFTVFLLYNLIYAILRLML